MLLPGRLGAGQQVQTMKREVAFVEETDQSLAN